MKDMKTLIRNQLKPLAKDEKVSQLEERPFKCSTCSMLFKLKKTLNQHEKTHSDEKPFNCEICGKRFITKGNLDKHFKIHLKNYLNVKFVAKNLPSTTI